MPELETSRAEAIRTLNNKLRREGQGGRIVITAGVAALSPETIMRIREAVAKFDAFTEDNDPYGEHDFGIIEMDGKSFYWKIDYYNSKLEFGSEDPTDPEMTTRVLTILLSEEY